MTTASFYTNANGFNIVKINGRKKYVNRVTELEQGEYSYEWVGIASGTPFKIFGGRASGGNRNEWFVEWGSSFDGYIDATSFADAIDIIETA